MEPSELLHFAAETLERLGIEYLVTGSMASIAYGEPRFTNDIDIVVRLSGEQVDRLCRSFPAEGFYVNVDAAREAVHRHGQFNVIHPTSGLKIDFMVAAEDEFNQSRFARRRQLDIAAAGAVSFAAPEDVILRKLEYYREGGSDKHLRDIRGILSLTGEAIDRTYLTQWVERLGVQSEWEDAIALGQ